MVIRHIAPVPPLPSPRGPAEDGVPEWSDVELLEALAGNDPRAGSVLYDRLIRVVEWTLLRVMGGREVDHEDLVQAAFEQIVISLHRRRYAHDCSLTSWASAIACHLALNTLRSRRRQRAAQRWSAVAEAEPAARQDLESQLAARQELERIRAQLAHMNPERAEVLVLHEVNGLELGEIAAALRISVAAAQSRLSRGRRELLARLAQGEQRRQS
jgi:RNA polymerase sigma-70 factor, ECF subfamily